MKDELEEAIKMQRFTDAQNIQKNIADVESKLNSLASKPLSHDVEVFREERNDPLTLLKCLSIVCELLKNAPVIPRFYILWTSTPYIETS